MNPGMRKLQNVLMMALTVCIFSTTSLAQESEQHKGSLEHPYTASDCQELSACPHGVYQFSPEQGNDAIQRAVDTIYKSLAADPQNTAIYNPKAEWSSKRFALLFAPGEYDVTVNVNYYTQVLGLGKDAKGVSLSNLHVDNMCFEGNITSCLSLGALNNFWRGVENVTFNPTTCRILDKNDKCIVWNVSQAAPMRNVIVNGDLMLNLAGCFDYKGQCDPSPDADFEKSGITRRCEGEFEQGFACGAGYASGGYLANTQVNGNISSIGQQQWFTRNSNFRNWNDGVWNMVFYQTQGTLPSQSTNPNANLSGYWPVFPFTSIDQPSVPIDIQNKPYLVYKDKTIQVYVPKTKEFIGIDHLAVLNQDNKDTAKINEALKGKRGLIIEPGIYSIDEPIQVNHDQLVLGIGLPELQCVNGNSCFEVSGQDAIVAGVMLAAGYKQSDSLLNVNKTLGNASSYNNATTLIDIFCRIGEAKPTRIGSGPTTKNCVSIHADYVVGDNLWLWRADHDRASGDASDPQHNLVQWDQNRTEHGLLVTGDHVAMFGLFSEHHNGSNVMWTGDNGITYFYQSELAYNAPKDWQCMDFLNPEYYDDKNKPQGGCPSYHVSPEAQKHQAYGLGVYTFFQKDTTIPAAVFAPAANSKLTHIVGRYLNASPQIVSNSGMSCLVKDNYNLDGKCYGPSAEQGDREDDKVNDPARLPALGKYPVQKQ